MMNHLNKPFFFINKVLGSINDFQVFILVKTKNNRTVFRRDAVILPGDDGINSILIDVKIETTDAPDTGFKYHIRKEDIFNPPSDSILGIRTYAEENNVESENHLSLTKFSNDYYSPDPAAVNGNIALNCSYIHLDWNVDQQAFEPAVVIPVPKGNTTFPDELKCEKSFGEPIVANMNSIFVANETFDYLEFFIPAYSEGEGGDFEAFFTDVGVPEPVPEAKKKRKGKTINSNAVLRPNPFIKITDDQFNSYPKEEVPVL